MPNCQHSAEWATVSWRGALFSENYFEVRDQYSMGGQHVANLSTHFSWKQVKWLVSNFLSALKALKLRNFLAACDKTYKHASLKIVANLLRLCLFVCVCCCAIVWKKVKSRPLWLVFKTEKAQKRFLSTQHHCSSILSMLKILKSMTQDAVKAIFIIHNLMNDRWNHCHIFQYEFCRWKDIMNSWPC